MTILFLVCKIGTGTALQRGLRQVYSRLQKLATKTICRAIPNHLHLLWVGLTRESLFEILARSETRILDPKFSRDFRETRESKLVARLAFRESHRQKFHSKNREKRVFLRNFVAKISSYKPRRKKFRTKSSFLRVSQTNFVARLASLANRNFVATLARIITNFNPGILRESWEKF
jgi:hypothetical protein